MGSGKEGESVPHSQDTRVDPKYSPQNSVDSDLTAGAQGPNGTAEESDKVQKRQRDRLRDQGSTRIYLKAIQGVLRELMPRRKGEVASRAKANTGERRGPGEGAAVGVTESAPHKEETSAPDVTAEEEEAGLETSVFCDNTALTDPRERPRERPLGDRRVVAGQGSPPLEVCNDSDSNFCSQKGEGAKSILGGRVAMWRSRIEPRLERFIDTHCRLDAPFARLSFQGTFAWFRKTYSRSFAKEFQGCTSDFCDPLTLTDGLWEDPEWGVLWPSPPFCSLLRELRFLLRFFRWLAGEDRFSSPATVSVPRQFFLLNGFEIQMCFEIHIFNVAVPWRIARNSWEVFERQLQLATSQRKPLVIHCRDAEEDLLKIMKKWVPPDYKIHRHCFTSSYRVMEPLLEHFPNMSQHVRGPGRAGRLRESPQERIVLESDTPYFLPRQVPRSACQCARPGLALHVVREITRVKLLSLSHTLAALRESTCHLLQPLSPHVPSGVSQKR
uniref:Uncharacterized protein n=1 Tax=Rangifer tarandus platyrhynchus TaxID=3082113 RepID=A0ACB0EHP6_RANTA|nr:unnamed protein product [Rangifer tarandus platyrhynchus]